MQCCCILCITSEIPGIVRIRMNSGMPFFDDMFHIALTRRGWKMPDDGERPLKPGVTAVSRDFKWSLGGGKWWSWGGQGGVGRDDVCLPVRARAKGARAP